MWFDDDDELMLKYCEALSEHRVLFEIRGYLVAVNADNSSMLEDLIHEINSKTYGGAQHEVASAYSVQ